MPQSRHRHKHHQKQQRTHTSHPDQAPVKARRKRSAALILAFVAAIFGSVIGAFSSESDLVWIIIGAVVGSIAGYMIGKEADKSAVSK